MDLLTSDDNLSKNHSGIKSLGGMGGPSGPQSIQGVFFFNKDFLDPTARKPPKTQLPFLAFQSHGLSVLFGTCFMVL